MALTRIGDQEWDFVGTDGREIKLPPACESAVAMPTRWRLFGPLGDDSTELTKRFHFHQHSARSLVDLDVGGLREIPRSLDVGGQTLEGRDVVLRDGALDLGRLFGGHQNGQQAFLFAELEVSAEQEAAFGAGCDYWMQWWIDGEVVLDTMVWGNHLHPPGPADHCFRCRLTAGKHIMAVRLVAGTASWTFAAGTATPAQEALSSLRFPGDSELDRWSYTPDLSQMRPPLADGGWRQAAAIRTDACLSDETIELEYQQSVDSGNFGIVLGAQDSGHYYYAYVPLWGQLWRARASYAAIGITDGSGYIRNLKMQLMPNVPCHWNMWKSLKVERRGSDITMWVNGVRGPSVRDDTYGPGRAGVAGFARYLIDDIKIDGTPINGPTWREDDLPGRTWSHVEEDLDLGDFQGPGQPVRLPDDEIILPIRIARDTSCHQTNEDNAAVYLYSSRDLGRTWSRYAGPMRLDSPARGPWFVPHSGVIRACEFDPDQRQFVLRESSDKALTWGEPMPGALLGDWERDLFREGCWNGLFGFTRLNDGALLAVILHGYKGMYDVIPNHGQGTWGTEVAQPYCTVSRDDGLTWSEPVPMDTAALNLGETPDSPCGGFSETSVAQLPGGRIVALARPFRSPYMWQTHSDDGGKTWRQACYAPFSGAGGPQLVATRSGYLVSIKRGPGVGLHISLDGGLNWDEGTMVDFPSNFNGSAIEVEPDVLLVTYPQAMDEIRPSYARTQRIRITPDGPMPL